MNSLEEIIKILTNRDSITLFIALWGAILATIKVLYDHQMKSRKIKVKISYGVISFPQGVSKVILVEAINNGYVDVTLTSTGVILPNKISAYFLSPLNNVQLPSTLSQGKSYTVWREIGEFSQELRRNGYSGKIKLKGFYRTATGEVFKSKGLSFEIE